MMSDTFNRSETKEDIKFNVNILSHVFEVELINTRIQLDVENLGRASLIDQKIKINKELPIDSRHSTLVHEVVHMVSDMNYLELTELQVSVVATGMFTFMRDNPLLMRAIIKGDQ